MWIIFLASSWLLSHLIPRILQHASPASMCWLTDQMVSHTRAWHFHFDCGVKCYLTSGLSHLDTSLWPEREHTHGALSSLIQDQRLPAHSQRQQTNSIVQLERIRQKWPLVFQQSLDDSKANNGLERTCGPAHVISAITARTDDPVYSTLPSLYECVCVCVAFWAASWAHERECIWKRKKKKKHIFTEHHYHCHWAASLKGEGRSKASAEMASGGGGWPRRGGEGQSLSELLRPPPPFLFSFAIAYFQPDLGFVHLVLWSRRQTSCPNFTCHTRLHLL